MKMKKGFTFGRKHCMKKEEEHIFGDSQLWLNKLKNILAGFSLPQKQYYFAEKACFFVALKKKLVLPSK